MSVSPVHAPSLFTVNVHIHIYNCKVKVSHPSNATLMVGAVAAAVQSYTGWGECMPLHTTPSSLPDSPTAAEHGPIGGSSGPHAPLQLSSLG